MKKRGKERPHICQNQIDVGHNFEILVALIVPQQAAEN